MKFYHGLWSTITLLFTFIAGAHLQSCKVPGKSKAELEASKAYQTLKPLFKKTYRLDEVDRAFYIGICTDATPSGGDSEAGVVEETKSRKPVKTVIGKYTVSSMSSGANWALLEYANREHSSPECSDEQKTAVILFTCDPTATDNAITPRLLAEEKAKGSDAGCYYLFQIPHPEVCLVKPSPSSLSVGSIILIVFFCVAAVYLIAGALYQRFVLGAKGVEQIPNYEFWKDFGNLQADGCNLVCRTQDARHSTLYKGLGDDQLEEPIERDDNLLPM